MSSFYDFGGYATVQEQQPSKEFWFVWPCGCKTFGTMIVACEECSKTDDE